MTKYINRTIMPSARRDRKKLSYRRMRVEQLESRKMLFASGFLEPILIPDVHGEITSDALFFVKTEVLDVLKDANDGQDSLSGPQFNSGFHFDGSHFSETAANIRDWYSQAIDYLNPNNFDEPSRASQFSDLAATSFGKILHAIQDFYAHSNWVELQNAGYIDKAALFDSSLSSFPAMEPYSQLAGALIVEEDSESAPDPSWSLARFPGTFIVTVSEPGHTWPGIITGSVNPNLYPADATPDSVAVSHGGTLLGIQIGDESLEGDLAKDKPSSDKARNDLYLQARTLAVLQSRHEYSRLIALVEDTYGDQGVQNLIGAWEGESKFDYGDLLDSYGTSPGANAARHFVKQDSLIHLGAKIDGEQSASISPTALGDDISGDSIDDEDGLVDSASDLNMTVGTAPLIRVRATNNSGREAQLLGWIDFNGNGKFENATERASIVVPDGSQNMVFQLQFPSIPFGSATQNVYARFRLSTDIAASFPTGTASDGEVEDYQATITYPTEGEVDANLTTQIDTLNLRNGNRGAFNFGCYMAPLGDLDGDGIADLAVGDAIDNPGGRAGAIYVLFLNKNGTVKKSVKIASDLNGGPHLDEADGFGISVAAIGDINGDGYVDLAVGASYSDAGGSERGCAYVLLLNGQGQAVSNVKLSSGQNGCPVLEDGAHFGSSIAPAGDVNGDGIPDFMVSSQINVSATGTRVALYTLCLDRQGAIIDSFLTKVAEDGPFYGIGAISLANIGDFDHNGVTDFAIDGGTQNDTGIFLLMLNNDRSIKDSVFISRSSSTQIEYSFGSSIYSLGDLDGDGTTDLLVGAYENSDSGQNRGAAYLVYLYPDGSVKRRQKIADEFGGGPKLNDNDFFGSSCALLGDLDGDGFPEVAVASTVDHTFGNPPGGAIYVFSFKSPEIEVSSNGIEIQDGDSTPSDSDGTDFGTISGDVSQMSHQFVISNLGSSQLELLGTPKIVVSGSSEFTVTLPDGFPNDISQLSTANFTVNFRPSTPGVKKATISILSNDGDESLFTFDVQGVAPQLNIASPQRLTIGAPFSLAISKEDLHGSVDTSFNGPVTLSLSANPTGAVLGGTLTVNAVAGVATFNKLSLNKLATGLTIQATSGTQSAQSAPIDVLAKGVAIKLVVTTQPAKKLTAGSAFGLNISAQDGFGVVDKSFTGPITLSLGANPGNATLGVTGTGKLTLNAVSGVAKFTNLVLDKPADGYSIAVTGTSLANGLSTTVSVVPGAPASAQFITQPPSTVSAGVPFSFSVRVFDRFGNPATNATTTLRVALAPNSSGAKLAGTLTARVVNGVATFQGLSISKSGLGFSLIVSGAGSSTFQSNPIAITAGTAIKMALAAPLAANHVAGAPIAMMVRLLDKFGNLAVDHQGEITAAILKNAGGSTLSGSTTATVLGGIAIFTDLSINKVGTGYTLKLSGANVPALTTSAFAIKPGVATQLVITTPPPSAFAAGAPFKVVVTARDAFGNTATTSTSNVVISIANNPGGSTLGGTLSVKPVNGVATFSHLTLNKVGAAYSLQLSSTGLPNVISSPITVSAGAVSGFQLISPPPAVVAAGQTFGFTVQAVDKFGNFVTNVAKKATLAISGGPTGGKLNGAPASGVAFVQGQAVFTGLSFTKAGSGYRIRVSAPGLTALVVGPITMG